MLLLLLTGSSILQKELLFLNDTSIIAHEKISVNYNCCFTARINFF